MRAEPAAKSQIDPVTIIEQTQDPLHLRRQALTASSQYSVEPNTVIGDEEDYDAQRRTRAAPPPGEHTRAPPDPRSSARGRPSARSPSCPSPADLSTPATDAPQPEQCRCRWPIPSNARADSSALDPMEHQACARPPARSTLSISPKSEHDGIARRRSARASTRSASC